jgi:hypothetical protein
VRRRRRAAPARRRACPLAGKREAKAPQ